MENTQKNISTLRPKIPYTNQYLMNQKVVSYGESISKVAEELKLKTSAVVKKNFSNDRKNCKEHSSWTSINKTKLRFDM
ncbi:LOW QUALITY PROTEIN: hypothetical protein MXB_4127 [Myxobolus squamalis]|nr:LOW QUALITY PROTEIN: hypothetical protein MXB_4127 [Myxobolus squamalis]